MWFRNIISLQNQDQHSKNLSLRDEYDKLRTEYAWLSEVVNNGCPNCSDHGFHLGETPDNEQHLSLKNARQEEEVIKKNLKKSFDSLD